jgi:site-specific DNA-cytosine methylase
VLESLYYTVSADYTGKTTGHVANLHININEAEKRVYSSDYKSPTLTTMQGGHRQPKVLIGDVKGDHIMRRLTPLECERLQTLEDNYTLFGMMNGEKTKISNSQRYKTVGNGWTVDVISHILMNI